MKYLLCSLLLAFSIILQGCPGRNPTETPRTSSLEGPNHIRGKWRAYSIKTTRTDKSTVFLSTIIQNSQLTLEVSKDPDPKLDDEATFKYRPSPTCALELYFASTYCCNEMRKAGLFFIGVHKETPAGCVKATTKADVDSVVSDLEISLNEKEYHFIHSTNKLQLRGPYGPAGIKTPPKSVTTTIEWLKL